MADFGNTKLMLPLATEVMLQNCNASESRTSLTIIVNQKCSTNIISSTSVMKVISTT